MASTTSSPIKSPNSKGPIGWFAPSFIAESISSFDATPSAKIPIPSLIIGIKILFTTNPGASFTVTGVFPISSDSLYTKLCASSDVISPRIISTNFIIGTGLKKCIPITLAGF